MPPSAQPTRNCRLPEQVAQRRTGQPPSTRSTPRDPSRPSTAVSPGRSGLPRGPTPGTPTTSVRPRSPWLRWPRGLFEIAGPGAPDPARSAPAPGKLLGVARSRVNWPVLSPVPVSPQRGSPRRAESEPSATGPHPVPRAAGWSASHPGSPGTTAPDRRASPWRADHPGFRMDGPLPDTGVSSPPPRWAELSSSPAAPPALGREPPMESSRRSPSGMPGPAHRVHSTGCSPPGRLSALSDS